MPSLSPDPLPVFPIWVKGPTIHLAAGMQRLSFIYHDASIPILSHPTSGTPAGPLPSKMQDLAQVMPPFFITKS